jgi:U3 small nucleolar RNA-associated protein 13
MCVGFAPGHADAIGAIGCSKRRGPFKTHGAFFASASSDKTLKLWRLNINELSNTTEMLTLESENSVRAHDKDINAVTVSPNDALVATGSQDKTIKLWRSSDLSRVGTLNGHKRGIWKVEFSTVDKCLASCSGDRTVKLWSVVDFTCLRTFQGHTGSVLAVQFVNHGMQLMSSSSDGLVKLWTIRTGECENTFDAHADKVWTLAVDAPNKRFVSGGSDSAICIWEDTTEQEEEAAIKAAEESLLKEQEMGNYLMQKQYKKVSLVIPPTCPFVCFRLVACTHYNTLLPALVGARRILDSARNVPGVLRVQHF